MKHWVVSHTWPVYKTYLPFLSLILLGNNWQVAEQAHLLFLSTQEVFGQEIKLQIHIYTASKDMSPESGNGMYKTWLYILEHLNEQINTLVWWTQAPTKERHVCDGEWWSPENGGRGYF